MFHVGRADCQVSAQPNPAGDKPTWLANACGLGAVGGLNMDMRVRSIKHPLRPDSDISATGRVDVKQLDAFVYGCTSSAQDALNSAPPPGFNEFERDQLKELIEGQRHSHKAIRKLLQGEQAASAVDALTIARLQLETLYSFCYMLQDAENVRLFMKNAWRKKYVRFLLQREERQHLPRFHDFFKTALPHIDLLQRLSCVTEAERQTIEREELGVPFEPGFTPARIRRFPSPMGIISEIKTPSQRKMLQRLYPEYQYLCSFAHPDPESSVFRALSDPRSRVQRELSSEQLKDFYQRQVLEDPVVYSAMSAVQTATEVADVCKADIDLLAKVTEAWSFFVRISLLAVLLWEMRAKEVLPLV